LAYVLKLGNVDVGQLVLVTSRLSLTKTFTTSCQTNSKHQFQTNPCIICWFSKCTTDK